MKLEEISSLGRSSSSTGSSSNRNTTTCTNINNSSTASSSSSLSSPSSAASRKILPASSSNSRSKSTAGSLFTSLLGSLSISSSLSAARRRFSLPYSSNSKAPSLGRKKVTGTLFGSRKGHVTFAVQEDPAATHPALLVELATSTSSLVKEMSSGLVRIALECHKKKISTAQSHNYNYKVLFSEPVWTMYCNGRKCGYATTRACSESDYHVLATIRSVSVGAGVIPPSTSTSDEGEEVLYMRARFERVVGSRDSEAFYMLNPDGNGGPDLSIFLLRL